MDQPSRAQIRLILDDAATHFKRAVDNRINAIYVSHGGFGRIQSGSTIKAAVAAMEEEAAKFITICVDRTKPIAMDMEAFAVIQETIETSLRFLTKKRDGVVLRASGFDAKAARTDGVVKAANSLFNDTLTQLRRQLEIHRFTFTVPAKPAAAMERPHVVAAKPQGGKPLAAHWDEMWARIAVALYLGDLQPKTQADIERAMKDWLASRNIDAGDTAVRMRARQLWQKLRESE